MSRNSKADVASWHMTLATIPSEGPYSGSAVCEGLSLRPIVAMIKNANSGGANSADTILN